VIGVEARTDIWNNTAFPVDTDPEAYADVTQLNTITIEQNALLRSVKDTNLLADDGNVSVLGKGVGRDLYREAAEAVASGVDKLFGGDGVSLDIEFDHSANAAQTRAHVDGTIQVGIQNKRYLTLDEDGNVDTSAPPDQQQSEGVTYRISRGESIASNIAEEIARLEQIKLDFSGNTAQEQAIRGGAQASIDRLTAQLAAMGGADITIDVIEVDDMWAQSSNINVTAGSLASAGTGRLEAPGDAVIQVVNHGPMFLRTGRMTIPDTIGGRIFMNGVRIDDLTSRPGFDPGQFAAGGIITASTSLPPLISILNDATPGDFGQPDPYGVPPDIYVEGEINNLLGVVDIRSVKGSVQVREAINADTIRLAAGLDFIQNFTLGIDHKGGDPKGPSQWGGVASTSQANKTDREVSGERGGSGATIAGRNVFIEAQFLNINGLIQSGLSDQTLLLSRALNSQMAAFKAGFVPGGQQYLDLDAEGNIVAKYDALNDRIEVENLLVQGGYMELYGHILNTGQGELRVLDGYGRVNIDNQTNKDLAVKSVNPGIGVDGFLKITDTAKRVGGGGSPLVTIYRHLDGVIEVVDNSVLDADGDPANPLRETDGRSESYAPLEGQYFTWVNKTTKSTDQKKVRTVIKCFFGLANCDESDTTTTTDIRSTSSVISAGVVTLGSSRTADYWYDNTRSVSGASWGSADSHTDDSFLGWGKEQWVWTRTLVEVDYHRHNVKAWHPIDINFIGYDEGGVDIRSDKNIVLLNSIQNPTGTTFLQADGAIVQRRSPSHSGMAA
jgi:hypothetical protein